MRLRLCPHCGGMPITVGEGRRWKLVKCGDCGCSTPKSTDMETAIDKWNARVNRGKN